MKKNIIVNFIILMMGNVYGHTLVYLYNHSTIPLVSPLGVVIKPHHTNIWRIESFFPSSTEAIVPRPWCKVKGCKIQWKGKPSQGTTPHIQVHQHKNKLVCQADYVPLKIVALGKSRKKKAKKNNNPRASLCQKPYPLSPSEQNGLYRLPPQETPSCVQKIETMVYSIPERKINEREGMAHQPTKVLFLEEPSNPREQERHSLTSGLLKGEKKDENLACKPLFETLYKEKS